MDQEIKRPNDRGHFVRPHDLTAEALAQELQNEAAQLIAASSLERPEDVPPKAVIAVLCSQMLCPTKGANISVQSAKYLSEISGILHRNKTAEIDEEVREILERLRQGPRGPRRVG